MERAGKSDCKRPRRYQKPQLVRYGLVRDLTAGGSGQSSEAANEDCENRMLQKDNPACP